MKTILLILTGLLFSSICLAQNAGQLNSKALLLQEKPVNAFLPAGSLWWSQRQQQNTQPVDYSWIKRSSFAPAYNPDHLAFFCRLEVQLEKATRFPVRFRLGDVQQVDYLEGKFEGWRYGY